MFGHQDNQQNQTDGTAPGGNDQPVDGLNPAASDNVGSPVVTPSDPVPTPGSNYIVSDSQQPAPDAAVVPDLPVAATDTDASDTNVLPTPTLSVGSDDLLSIKQSALEQLSPLVGHLDQTPEEKFRTTMMMIQAADNQALLQTAYEAAQQITDEKARAQALLDIVNEINYFTQHQAA